MLGGRVGFRITCRVFADSLSLSHTHSIYTNIYYLFSVSCLVFIYTDSGGKAEGNMGYTLPEHKHELIAPNIQCFPESRTEQRNLNLPKVNKALT